MRSFYQVGDTVIIRESLSRGEVYARVHVVSHMIKYAGRTAVITKDITGDGHNYRLDIDSEHWGWDEEMFETPEARETDSTLLINLYVR